VKPANPEEITLEDLFRSGVAETVVSLAIYPSLALCV
jgi:hypothetical protein